MKMLQKKHNCRYCLGVSLNLRSIWFKEAFGSIDFLVLPIILHLIGQRRQNDSGVRKPIPAFYILKHVLSFKTVS